MTLSTKKEPLVSIAVLTYNRCDYLRRLLGSLQKLSYPSLEILVVDNHSEDGTDDVIPREFPQARYIRMETNRGAASRNVGLTSARGEIVITLDDDIAGLETKDIIEVVQLFASNSCLAAVNFRIVDGSSGELCNWVHHCDPERHQHETFATYEITEGAVAFRKTALVAVGYYGEQYFLSHEGPDLALRLLDAGFSVIYSPNVTVRHFKAQAGRTPWRNYYYDTRNQFWLACRNFPLGYSMLYLTRGLFAIFVYSLRDGYFRYWLRGVRDGILGLKEVRPQRRVLRPETMRLITEINKKRPALAFYLRKRIFRRGFGV
jgi:GT2 family glycosyltransferase